MKSRALVVPREAAEAARRALAERGGLRTDLRVGREGDRIALPITEGAKVAPGSGEVGDREFEELRPPRAHDYRELVRLAPELRAKLPRSFDVVGDLVLIRLPEELLPSAAAIGTGLLAFVPGARRVGIDHGVHGPERRRRIEPIAGTGPFRTVHRENGLELEVDLERAYFSPRLAREHARVASAVGPGERVYDLCCGIGPFALSIARAGRARAIVAVDANPDAIALLRSTMERHAPGAPIEPVVEDVGAFLARCEPADRAVLNLPHEGIKYLPSVATIVRPGGAIHYYEVVPRRDAHLRAEELVNRIGGPSLWTTSGPRTVHPYSPREDLAGFDFARAPEGPG